MGSNQTQELRLFDTDEALSSNLLDIDAAAKTLKVSTATIRNWRITGKLSAIRQGRAYLFRDEDIYSLMPKSSSDDRLTKRANKKASTKRFSPREYSLSKPNILGVQMILERLSDDVIEKGLSEVLFVCTLIYLYYIKAILVDDLSKLDASSIKSVTSGIKKHNLKVVLTDWHKELDTNTLNSIKEQVTDIRLEQQKDLLGFLYQSMLQEGKKSELGSYYTPSWIVDGMVDELVSKTSKVADPCCGTGQFLLSFAAKVKDPAKVYGFDIDPVAARLARINLILAYNTVDFEPHIYTLNTLTSKDSGTVHLVNSFDIVATNPPWGAEYEDDDKVGMLQLYPEIKSLESFSYFLVSGMQLLKDKGVLSFVLPEAILNVKQHNDIRKFILTSYEILGISYLERPFSGVFSKVIRLDIRHKTPTSNSHVRIRKQGKEYQILQERFLKRNDYIIDANITDIENNIIEKIFSVPHVTLRNKADWALGVVTGNNKKYISDFQDAESKEPIYKGKDVTPFFLKPANAFIEFLPDQFQQVAPISKYRSDEKLIYKFISDKLIFAYDDKQQLTLNSANILIPNGTLPAKILTAVLNSSIYQFIFSKKHNSIKVLRHHIEGLPLPDFDVKSLRDLEDIVIDIFKNRDLKNFNYIEQKLFEYFGFDEEEKTIIKSYGVV